MVIKKLSSFFILINYSSKKITKQRNVEKKNENNYLESKKIRRRESRKFERQFCGLKK